MHGPWSGDLTARAITGSGDNSRDLTRRTEPNSRLLKFPFFLSKTKTTFFEASYFPQRFRHGPNFKTYKQHILYLASRRYEPVDTSGREIGRAHV